MLLVIAILVLLLTALVMLTLRLVRPTFAYHWLIAAFGSLASFPLVLAAGFSLPGGFDIKSTFLTFQTDRLSWPLAAGIAAAAFAVIYTAATQMSRFDWPAWTGSLTICAFGLAAVLAGAAQLWNVAEPRHGLPYLVVAQSGVALLAGLWSGQHAALAVTAASLALLLGASLIYLSGGHDEQRPWLASFRLVGVATLLGAPLTVGFLGAGRLYTGLIESGGWGWLVLVVLGLGMALLAAGLLYTTFWPGTELTGEPLAVAAFYSGLTLPAALAVVLAVFGSVLVSVLGLPAVGPLGFGAPGSVAAAAIAVAVAAAGVALWRFEAPVRARLGAAGEWLLGSAGRLHWLYRLVWGGIRGAGALIGHLAGVLEGEGAILWALVAGLLAWLALRP
jgi:hypothetical protein